MSDEENSKDEAAPETETTGERITSPDAKVPGKWEMPKPIFQQTSGYLPQGFVKQVEGTFKPPPLAAGDAIPSAQPPEAQQETASEPAAAPEETWSEPSAVPQEAPDEPASAPPPPEIQAAAVGEIEPQPHLSEEYMFDEDVLATPAAAPKKRGALRTVLIVLGVLALIGVLAGFLAFVYFFFILQSGEVNNF